MENIKYPVGGNAEINLAANELNEENTEKVSGGRMSKKKSYFCEKCGGRNGIFAATCKYCGHRLGHPAN